MFRTKVLLIGLMIFFCAASALADKKKVFFFPMAADKSDIKFSEKYTSSLKNKLEMTDVFNVMEINDFKKSIEEGKNPFELIKGHIDRNYSKGAVESAVFSYLEKSPSGYRVRAYLYFIPDKNVITAFSENVLSEDQIEMSSRDCAIEFASRILSIQGSRLFFSSALIPGMGHFKMKKYIKSALFFGGFSYLIGKYSSIGSLESTDNVFTRAESTTNIGLIRYQYFEKGQEISQDEWDSKRLDWIDRLNDRKRKKQYYQVGIGLVYIANILDTIRSMKDNYSKRHLQKKLIYDVMAINGDPSFRLQFRF